MESIAERDTCERHTVAAAARRFLKYKPTLLATLYESRIREPFGSCLVLYVQWRVVRRICASSDDG
jgi:hypothetical protein